MSSQDKNLKSLRNEVFALLGRQVYNFCQVENWLKYLVAVNHVTSTGIHSNIAHINKKTQKMMLGQLVGEIMEKWEPNASPSKPNLPTDLFDITITISHKLEMSLDDYQSLKQSLENMLSDRNMLTHQFANIYPLNSIENCKQAITCLSDCREKHLPTMESLSTVVKEFQDLIKDLDKNMQIHLVARWPTD